MAISFLVSSCNKNSENAIVDENVKTQVRDANEAVGPTCYDNLQIVCNPPNIIRDTIEITDIVGYPGCKFYVDVTYNLCQTNQTMYFGNILMISYDCPQYTIDAQNAISQGQFAQANFYFEFEKKLRDAVMRYFQNNLGISITTFVWYLESCKQYCYIYGSNEGVPQIIVRSGRCGIGCCLQTSQWISNPNGGSWVSTYNQIGTPNCGTISPEFRKCDAVSACIMTCQ